MMLLAIVSAFQISRAFEKIYFASALKLLEFPSFPSPFDKCFCCDCPVGRTANTCEVHRSRQ
jgi:hypothetical protein